MLSESEVGQPVHEIRIPYTQSQNAALGAIEAGAGDRDALVEVFDEMLDQRAGCAADIGVAGLAMELGMGNEGLQQFAFLLILFEPVEVEEIVDPEAVGRGHEAVNGNIALQGAGGADADDIERGQFRFDLAGIEVDIDQGVELIYDDIDIIGTDAGGEDGDAFVAHASGMGDEFAVLGYYFDLVEVFADLADPIGVADGDDGGCQFLGAEVEVIDGATVVDD